MPARPVRTVIQPSHEVRQVTPIPGVVIGRKPTSPIASRKQGSLVAAVSGAAMRCSGSVAAMIRTR